MFELLIEIELVWTSALGKGLWFHTGIASTDTTIKSEVDNRLLDRVEVLVKLVSLGGTNPTTQCDDVLVELIEDVFAFKREVLGCGVAVAVGQVFQQKIVGIDSAKHIERFQVLVVANRFVEATNSRPFADIQTLYGQDPLSEGFFEQHVDRGVTRQRAVFAGLGFGVWIVVSREQMRIRRRVSVPPLEDFYNQLKLALRPKKFKVPE